MGPETMRSKLELIFYRTIDSPRKILRGRGRMCSKAENGHTIEAANRIVEDYGKARASHQAAALAGGMYAQIRLDIFDRRFSGIAGNAARAADLVGWLPGASLR